MLNHDAFMITLTPQKSRHCQINDLSDACTHTNMKNNMSESALYCRVSPDTDISLVCFCRADAAFVSDSFAVWIFTARTANTNRRCCDSSHHRWRRAAPFFPFGTYRFIRSRYLGFPVSYASFSGGWESFKQLWQANAKKLGTVCLSTSQNRLGCLSGCTVGSTWRWLHVVGNESYSRALNHLDEFKIKSSV